MVHFWTHKGSVYMSPSLDLALQLETLMKLSLTIFCLSTLPQPPLKKSGTQKCCLKYIKMLFKKT